MSLQEGPPLAHPEGPGSKGETGSQDGSKGRRRGRNGQEVEAAPDTVPSESGVVGRNTSGDGEALAEAIRAAALAGHWDVVRRLVAELERAGRGGAAGTLG